ncbi:hypothetical protein [Brevundimonas naejangsanensis]|uniref:hypothetical protein n=1 Tax=Brevundimonas naejangsanensis TaxID=588932 RepID=UPI003D04436F
MIGPRFERNPGLTASERILADLADRSFLKLWTYANPYKELNRELTDLIVVFGDDVLLFSDKAGAYPDSGDPAVDWRRYFRSAIANSARQIRTAEQWIRQFPDRVYLDVRCETPLPLGLPPVDRLRVHRICVAPAATDAARQRSRQTGLAIMPEVIDDALPYAVGQVTGCRGWVHVFDEDTMSVVLPALSTASDFIAYLRAKENLIAAEGLRYAPSEKDLLAIYLLNERSFPRGDGALDVPEGSWDALAAHPQFQMAQALNRRGDLWDRLIERITDAIVQGNAVMGNDVEMADFEKVVRCMAAEDRFDRRVLSGAVLERAQRAVGATISSVLPSQADPTVGYVLLIKDHDIETPYEEYREVRRMEMLLRVHAAAVARPEFMTIIGLALDAPNGRGGSEDFVYLDAAAATVDERAEWAAMRRERRYFIEGVVEHNRVTEDEYPDFL